MRKYQVLIVAVVLFMFGTANCSPAAVPPSPIRVRETVVVERQTTVEVPVEVVVTTTPEGAKVLKVFGAFATPIEEPWDGVIHTALLEAQTNGRIEYTYQDNIGYAGDMERVLRETSEKEHPDIIFGDAFGNEEVVRKVAGEFPNIAFVFGSGFGPTEPNVSVFDNWIHEPAYLIGLIAGKMTKTNIVGVVGGVPVPEVNRLINAFTQGAKESNPDVRVKVTFINSWFDPVVAKEAALAQINAGADVLYAERFGVIEAAQENKLLAFGNMSDQYDIAPDTVVTGPVWNMGPTVQYVIEQVAAGSYTAQELKDFSMYAKGGASLANWHGWDAKLPTDVVKLVKDKEAAIKAGQFRVDINEGMPESG